MKASIWGVLLFGCGAGVADVATVIVPDTVPEDTDTGAPPDTDTDTDTALVEPSCPFDGSYVVVDGGSAVISSDGVGCVLELALPTEAGCEMIETSTFEEEPGGGIWAGASSGIESCEGELWGAYVIEWATFEWDADVLTVQRAGAFLSGTILHLTQP